MAKKRQKKSQKIQINNQNPTLKNDIITKNKEGGFSMGGGTPPPPKPNIIEKENVAVIYCFFTSLSSFLKKNEINQ